MKKSTLSFIGQCGFLCFVSGLRIGHRGQDTDDDVAGILELIAAGGQGHKPGVLRGKVQLGLKGGLTHAGAESLRSGVHGVDGVGWIHHCAAQQVQVPWGVMRYIWSFC